MTQWGLKIHLRRFLRRLHFLIPPEVTLVQAALQEHIIG